MSMTLHTVAAVRAQAYAEIMQVLKSLPSVKDVRVRVRAAYFGVEWASSEDNDQEFYTGVLDATLFYDMIGYTCVNAT